jgi:enoyl-CoA hydratase/carnithine racemase
MNDAAVLVQPGPDAWRLTLHRPAQGNACSVELVGALDAALAEAEAAGARAVVLRAEGRHFCTGFDLSALDSETDDSLLARFVRIELLLQRIARAPFQTIAAAQGRTVGAGADLFVACRIRLAVAGVTFAFPGARGFGLVLGTRRLAACVGADTALDWVESGRSVEAEEAVTRGLATAAVADAAALDAFIAKRTLDDAWLRAALSQAARPQARDDDARDLELLVRSAARPGLRERISAYLARVAAARAARN